MANKLGATPPTQQKVNLEKDNPTGATLHPVDKDRENQQAPQEKGNQAAPQVTDQVQPPQPQQKTQPRVATVEQEKAKYHQEIVPPLPRQEQEKLLQRQMEAEGIPSFSGRGQLNGWEVMDRLMVVDNPRRELDRLIKRQLVTEGVAKEVRERMAARGFDLY